MVKGLCPGVGRSREKESVEKRGRERRRPVFLGVREKPMQPLHRASSRGGLESPGGKVSSAGSSENQREPQPPGFGTKKCKVRELEKVRFEEKKT